MGDSSIFELYKELTKKELTYQDLLQEEDILKNLYYHLIRDGSQTIRIPSAYCHKKNLTKHKLAEKTEQIINLLVSSAKKAIEITNANILNCGVISYIAPNTSATFWEEMQQNIAEKTILLSDFGVDAIFVEAIDNWRVMKKTLLIIQEQCAQPLAPFFAIQNLQEPELEEYQELYQNLQLEMLGLEIEPVDLVTQRAKIFSLAEKLQVGFLLKNFQTSEETDLAVEFFKKTSPTALFGGVGVKRQWWNHFCQKYFG
jgi:hypothetical protein